MIVEDGGKCRSFLVFDWSDGILVWCVEVFVVEFEVVYLKNGYVFLMLVMDGEFVFMYFGLVGFVVFDFDGKF